jgi:hypothetical protein
MCLTGVTTIWSGPDPLLQAIKCPSFLDNWKKRSRPVSERTRPTAGLDVQNVRKLYEAGVRIALRCHDAGTNRILGWGSHMELEAFVNWVGMTPQAAMWPAPALRQRRYGWTISD